MNPLRLLAPFFIQQRGRFALGAFFLLLTNLLHQLLPLLLKEAIDSLRGGLALSAAALWAALRFGAAALQAAARYGWRMGFFGTSRRVEHAMRRALFDRLLELPPLFYARRRLGDLVSRMISDLTQLREALGFGGMALLDSLSMICLTAFFMARLDWSLTLLCLLPMASIPPLVMVLGRRLRDLSHRAQQSLDQLSQAATESFRGARVLHAYAREEAEMERFQALAARCRDDNMRAVRLEAVYWPLLTLAAGFSEILLFYFGGLKVASGELSLGGFAALNDYLLNLVWPAMALGFTTNLYVRGKVSLERLGEILQAQEALPEVAREGGTRREGRWQLEWRELSFSFEGSPRPALRGFSLALAPGEWLGLAGRTGAGKSTALKLAARLYDPQAGSVVVEGVDARAWPLRELRSYLALVEQEPCLFSEPILDNIALGQESPSLAEAIRCAEAADAHDFIAALPEGYRARLGERGVNLSGGQKQRLALARALYRKPRLLLLDDAFSAVDTATEERIVSALRRAWPGMSVVLVSHRLSTLFLCDRVAVLEDGRVVEQGSPRELMQREGFLVEMARREQAARRAGLRLP